MTAVDGSTARTERSILADGSFREAMSRAGRLLSSRPRTEQEVSTRLASAGFDPSTVDRVVRRLRELRLVDDTDFARRWVTERGLDRGREALVIELETKGVGRDISEAALNDAAPDQTAVAIELARRRLKRVINLPLASQAARLFRFLGSKGFPEEVAEQAVRAVLPPEGWD